MSYLKDVSIHERAPPVRIYKRALILIVFISYHIHYSYIIIILYGFLCTILFILDILCVSELCSSRVGHHNPS
jgi:hypothetical protein